MANPEKLNQHLMRTMLLEGENGEKVLNAIRTFIKSDKTDEDQHLVVDVIKKEITRSARELASDDQVDKFLADVTKQL